MQFIDTLELLLKGGFLLCSKPFSSRVNSGTATYFVTYGNYVLYVKITIQSDGAYKLEKF